MKDNKNVSTETETVKTKLWSRDFTIITLGSFVSMLGAAVVGCAFGFLVYDKTESSLLYSLTMVAFVLPQLIIPIFAGAFFDKHSRRKAIYIFDYISTLLFAAVTVICYFDKFNYVLSLIIVLIFGSINAAYMVAYDSFYPNLIAKGNYSKAYAISSLLYPIASTVMVPVAGWTYDRVGVVPLFAFSTVTFFITATFEVFVRAKEPHLLALVDTPIAKTKPLKQFSEDLKFGLSYIKQEKGLLVITLYFFCTMAAGAVLSTLYLPFLRTNFSNVDVHLGTKTFVCTSSLLYSIIMGSNTVGRLIGGLIHYLKRINPEKKFKIALFVYVTIGVLDAIVLFMPYWWLMAIVQVISGMLAVTSFNIRISGTQNHVPDNVRARFNGTFSLITMAGQMLGQLAGGTFGEWFDARYIVLIAMCLNMLAIWTIMYAGRKHVKPVYNNQI
jgi:Major Facilitator Superfamily.